MRTSFIRTRRRKNRGPKYQRHTTRQVLVAAILFVTLTTLNGAAHAADAKSVADLERRIQELEDTVRDLKKDTRKLEVSEEDRAKQKPLAAWDNGFKIASADGKFKLKIGGYVQSDGRFFLNDNTNLGTSQFLFRRVRPVLSGTVFKYVDFKVMPDFAGSKLVLFDAYADLNYFPAARLRIGKYKPPVGFERLQSGQTLFFVERGLPTNLVPNRDNGVQLFADLFQGSVSYAVGVFNGVPDLGNGDGDVNDGKDFAGRVFGLPFKNTALVPLRGLGVGVSGTYGHERGKSSSPDLPTYKSTGQASIFSYASNSADASKTAVAFGPLSRISPQAHYFWGPIGLLGEYVSSTQRANLGSKFGTFKNSAWQVVGVYALTGEAESYNGIVPAQAFDPWAGTWGALEIAARYGVLDIDGDVFGERFADPKKSIRQAKEWVVGANWHLNKNVKFVLNYANTDFKGGASKGDRRSERAILSRVQLAF